MDQVAVGSERQGCHQSGWARSASLVVGARRHLTPSTCPLTHGSLPAPVTTPPSPSQPHPRLDSHSLSRPFSSPLYPPCRHPLHPPPHLTLAIHNPPFLPLPDTHPSSLHTIFSCHTVYCPFSLITLFPSFLHALRDIDSHLLCNKLS